MFEDDALPPDVLDLIASAKAIEDVPCPRRDAIFRVVEARLALPSAASTPRASLGGGASALGTKTVGLALILTFAVGAVTGIAVDRALRGREGARAPAGASTLDDATSKERGGAPPAAGARAGTSAPSMDLDGAPRTASSAPPALRENPAPRSDASPRSAQVASALRGAAARPDPAQGASARGLAAERALLDVARSALAVGESGAALAAAQRHATEYPSGALVEEREAIAIKALHGAGRVDEARDRARAYERRFPNGLMLPSVRAVTSDAP